MNIILSGYGRMGKEVENIALQRGHQVLYRLNSAEDWKSTGNELNKGDVLIDFSWPESAVENIRRAFDLGLPVVMGTTGWYDKLPQVKQWCSEGSATIMVAANFNIGVNMMLHISGKLASMLNRFEVYDLSIEEVHHIHKLDAPSGTAIKLAEEVLEHQRAKKRWSTEREDDPAVLHIKSIREGEVPGTHILKAESADDMLEIIHTARNRKGFATGAILAAEWLQGKKGFFGMQDLLEWTD